MKIRALVFLSAVSLLHAGQKTLTISSDTLPAWTVIGADVSSLSTQPALILPAGAQLIRSFGTEVATVRLVSQPTLGKAASDWPGLEMGPAVLIFSREGATGRLLLLLGDEPAKPLPITFSLDIDGRSVSPVSVRLSFDATRVTVASGLQMVEFPAPVAPAPFEIGLLAGGSAPWEFQLLEITVAAPAPSAAPVAAPPANSVASAFHGSNPAPGESIDGEKSVPPPTSPVLLDAKPAKESPEPVVKQNSPAGSTLEIYTPSPIWPSRSAASLPMGLNPASDAHPMAQKKLP